MAFIKKKETIFLNCDSVLNSLYYKRGVEFFEFKVVDADFESWLNNPVRFNKDFNYEKDFADWVDYLKKNFMDGVLYIPLRFDLVHMIHISLTTYQDPDNINFNYPYFRVLLGMRCLVPLKPKLMGQRILDEFRNIDPAPWQEGYEIFDLKHLETYEEVQQVWYDILTNGVKPEGNNNQILSIMKKDGEWKEYCSWEALINSINFKPPYLFEPFRFFFEDFRDASIEGLNFRLSPSKSTILLNLIRIFMEQNNLFVDNGWIYQRDEKNNSESQIIKMKNFFELSERMIKFLSRRFVHQINEEELNLLLLESADECLKKMLAVPALLPQRPNKQISNLVLRKDVEGKGTIVA